MDFEDITFACLEISKILGSKSQFITLKLGIYPKIRIKLLKLEIITILLNSRALNLNKTLNLGLVF